MLTIRFEPIFFGISPILGPTPRFHLVGAELRLRRESPPVAHHRGYEWCHGDGFHIVLRVDSPVRVRFESAHEMTVGPFAMLRIADGHLQTGEGRTMARFDDQTGLWQIWGEESVYPRITVECACPHCAQNAVALRVEQALAGEHP